jgi:hypothetical protein
VHLHLQPRVLATMSPPTREAYLTTRNNELMRQANPTPLPPSGTTTQSDQAGSRTVTSTYTAIDRAANFRNDMALEREFVAAGGLLLAGPDPTGDGGTLPGFGDQREIELLVDAGFTPLEAIKIGTLNGATFEGLANHIGTIAVGKNADLVVVTGDPSHNINDIENTVLIFKDGIAFDSQALLNSVRGRYGQY